MAFNRFFGEGNLTRDVEVKNVGSTTVARFAVAVSNRKKDKTTGEWVNDPAFLECEAWDKGADAIAQHFAKGDPIQIEASIKQDNWEDKASGQKRSRLIFNVQQFHFVKGYDYEGKGWQKRGEASDNAAPKSKAKPKPSPVAAEDDDASIPF